MPNTAGSLKIKKGNFTDIFKRKLISSFARDTNDYRKNINILTQIFKFCIIHNNPFSKVITITSSKLTVPWVMKARQEIERLVRDFYMLGVPQVCPKIWLCRLTNREKNISKFSGWWFIRKLKEKRSRNHLIQVLRVWKNLGAENYQIVLMWFLPSFWCCNSSW